MNEDRLNARGESGFFYPTPLTWVQLATIDWSLARSVQVSELGEDWNGATGKPCDSSYYELKRLVATSDAGGP